MSLLPFVQTVYLFLDLQAGKNGLRITNKLFDIKALRESVAAAQTLLNHRKDYHEMRMKR